MNLLLWILQFFLAIHTAVGAVWKFSNPEGVVPSLQAIPHWMWLALAVVEIFCSVGLILPAFRKHLSFLAPMAAAFIAAEMLLFAGLHLSDGAPEMTPLIYWLVVAAVCAIIAFGRFKMRMRQGIGPLT